MKIKVLCTAQNIALGVFEVPGDEENEVNNHPNTTSASGEELQNANDHMTIIKAVDTQESQKPTEQKANEPAVLSKRHGSV
jgi:hypothetical protein